MPLTCAKGPLRINTLLLLAPYSCWVFVGLVRSAGLVLFITNCWAVLFHVPNNPTHKNMVVLAEPRVSADRRGHWMFRKAHLKLQHAIRPLTRIVGCVPSIAK